MSHRSPLVTLGVLSFVISAVCAQVPESAFNADPWPMAKQGPVKVFIQCGL
jgi:hypothetical protein